MCKDPLILIGQSLKAGPPNRPPTQSFKTLMVNNSLYSRYLHASIIYDAKYTTRKPTQLPTTPIAEYELVNINGRNS